MEGDGWYDLLMVSDNTEIEWLIPGSTLVYKIIGSKAYYLVIFKFHES